MRESQEMFDRHYSIIETLDLGFVIVRGKKPRGRVGPRKMDLPAVCWFNALRHTAVWGHFKLCLGFGMKRRSGTRIGYFP